MRASALGLVLVVSLAGCSSEDSKSASGGSSGGGASGAGGAGAGSASGGSGGSGGGGGSATCGGEPTRTGEATYYDVGQGNCGFEVVPGALIGAMNQTDYENSAACGACARLDGPKGSVTVRIVDRCPECPAGDIDLSPEAFEMIADLPQGRVPISWQYVPCDVSGPIGYRFKEGSNQWWTAVQLRNHRHAIASLEYEREGTFVKVPRLEYNYFVEEAGMGPGPYTFRVTDVYGHQLVDTGIAHQEAQVVDGAAQLPACN